MVWYLAPSQHMTRVNSSLLLSHYGHHHHHHHPHHCHHHHLTRRLCLAMQLQAGCLHETGPSVRWATSKRGYDFHMVPSSFLLGAPWTAELPCSSCCLKGHILYCRDQMCFRAESRPGHNPSEWCKRLEFWVSQPQVSQHLHGSSHLNPRTAL